jgi:hypothetical protein
VAPEVAGSNPVIHPYPEGLRPSDSPTRSLAGPRRPAPFAWLAALRLLAFFPYPRQGSPSDSPTRSLAGLRRPAPFAWLTRAGRLAAEGWLLEGVRGNDQLCAVAPSSINSAILRTSPATSNERNSVL